MCEHCGRRSVGRLCKSCELVERHDEEANRPCNQDDTHDVPECFDCGGDATGGAYCPDRIGVLLCPDCHPDPDNGRKPADGSETAVATDGGVDVEDEEEDGESVTETHIPEDDAVIMTDGGVSAIDTTPRDKHGNVLNYIQEPTRDELRDAKGNVYCAGCTRRLPANRRGTWWSDRKLWCSDCYHNKPAGSPDKPVLMTDGGEHCKEDELPNLHVGDYVVDQDADDAATMLVVGLDTCQAKAYELEDDGPTVADVNPDYSETDDVVEVVFPQRTDMDVDKKRYAYPRGRLRLDQPIHDRDGEVDDAVTKIAEHIVESHTNIDDRLTEIESRLDRAEHDIDIIDGGF